MKARMPIPNRQKKRLREYAAAEIEAQGKDRTRRFFKLMCVALHELYGFGSQRLGAVIDRISTLTDEHRQDEMFWRHVDRVVIEELGMPFDREQEGRT